MLLLPRLPLLLPCLPPLGGRKEESLDLPYTRMDERKPPRKQPLPLPLPLLWLAWVAPVDNPDDAGDAADTSVVDRVNGRSNQIKKEGINPKLAHS